MLIKQKLSITLIPVLLSLLLIVTACQAKDNSWKIVEERGVLYVGLDPTYPPFAVADENGVYGLDIDLANAIAAKHTLETNFVLFGYDGLYDALTTGQVDILISALTILPEKREDFAYSDPYFNAGEYLIVPQAENDIEEMADLNGRILAVELGALGHVEATKWAKRIPNLTIQPYPSPDEALTAVSQGNANAVLIDAISGRLFINRNPQLKLVEPPITVEPFAIVTRIEDEQMLKEINTTLENLQESGEFNTIMQKWLAP